MVYLPMLAENNLFWLEIKVLKKSFGYTNDVCKTSSEPNTRCILLFTIGMRKLENLVKWK